MLNRLWGPAYIQTVLSIIEVFHFGFWSLFCEYKEPKAAQNFWQKSKMLEA